MELGLVTAIVVDETADLNEAAKNIMISKTSDFGSGVLLMGI